jgi:branched-subunit amino acid transport protein
MRVALSMLAVTVANWVMKASGPLALGHRQLPSTARRVVALMAPTLLAGLIVVELGDPDGGDLNWTQIGGVAVAGAARLLKLPMLLAVLCGAAATAVLRLM